MFSRFPAKNFVERENNTSYLQGQKSLGIFSFLNFSYGEYKRIKIISIIAL
jgi:hypothetical protein